MKRAFRATIKSPHELGSAESDLLKRHRRALRCAKLLQSQSDQRRCRVPCCGIAALTTSCLAPISAGRNSITCRSRIRAGLSPSPAPLPGSDFADFLLGIPDTSSIAFGNADKYFRESVYDAFLNDDWRISPELTLNAGVRWEYGAPITELYGRLVNLDIAPGFAAVAPVVASDPDRPADRPALSRLAGASRQARFRAARGHRLASDFRIVDGGSRRIRRLLRHFGLSDHRRADGAATAAVEEP